MKEEKAFTLIELLVVIAVIGLLALVVFVSLEDVRAGARDSKRKVEANALTRALELYYSDEEHYPINSDDWCSIEEDCLDGLAPYFRELPGDPLYPEYTYQYISDKRGQAWGLDVDLENGESFTFCGGIGLTGDDGDGGDDNGDDCGGRFCTNPDPGGSTPGPLEPM